jgi:hypothetical protein
MLVFLFFAQCRWLFFVVLKLRLKGTHWLVYEANACLTVSIEQCLYTHGKNCTVERLRRSPTTYVAISCHCSEHHKQPFISYTSQCIPFSRNFNTTKTNCLHYTKKIKTIVQDNTSSTWYRCPMDCTHSPKHKIK